MKGKMLSIDVKKENSLGELHSVLNEKFLKCLKHGSNIGSGVFKVEGTILEVTRPNSFKGKQADNFLFTKFSNFMDKPHIHFWMPKITK